MGLHQTKKSLGFDISTISHTGVGTMRASHQQLPAHWQATRMSAVHDLAELEELAKGVKSGSDLADILEHASFL